MNKIILTVVLVFSLLIPLHSAWAISEIELWFQPERETELTKVHKIADELGQEIGIKIIPRVADCYPQILTALTRKKPVLRLGKAGLNVGVGG